MRARNIWLSASVLTAFVVLGSGSASAASITFQFGGTITSLDGFTSPPFAIGDPFSLTLTADSTDAADFPGVGKYTTSDVSFFVGSYTGSAAGGVIGLTDDSVGLPPIDAWISFATVAEGLNGTAVDGLPLSLVGITLFDNDATAFANDALVPIVSLDAFESKTFVALFCSSFTGDANSGRCSNPNAEVRGQITSVTSSVSTVPEPGTIALVGSGFVALGRRRHRHCHTA